jgi:hypothetical protein
MTVPLAFGVFVVLVLFVLPAWQAWRSRTRLLERLRTEWGLPRTARRDMEAIADSFRSRDQSAAVLDDRTWNDLLMDEVFAHLDRTESSVGQQMLYCRLRSAPAPRALDAFDALVRDVTTDASRRERAQVTLSRLRSSAGYYVHRLARPDAIDRPRWHVVYPLWTAAALLIMASAFLQPKLLVVALFCYLINFFIRIINSRRAAGQIVWFRYVGPLLAAGARLSGFDRNETAAITGTLKSDLAALSRLGRIARWVSRDPLATDPLAFVILELLNVLFLLDTNALYLAASELRSHGAQLLTVIETVGEIDAAMAIASFRTGTDGWIRPRFSSPDAPATFVDLRHLLLDEPVPNSIALAPPHGVVVTGSNMSGKSTFLRTVGVNAVLAQSIDTCLARRYEAPIYHVRSCIGRSDDLIAGKSYYLVEVESVLALVAASEETTPHLFIFDELFRGTNAVERIAAGEAVLRALIAEGRRHVVLAATHDAELVDLLRDRYVVYHLGDAIGPNGLTFDYRLTPGPATSRNAIALLKLSGAPESLVAHALERAAELDRARSRSSGLTARGSTDD